MDCTRVVLHASLAPLTLALLAVPRFASAAPQACGVDSDGRAACSVVAGDAELSTLASSFDGGEFLAIATIGDAPPSFSFQGFSIYSFDESEYIDVRLDSATEDPVTRTIVVQFTEAFANALRATAVFTLNDSGETTVIDQTYTFLSMVPPGFSASGRFYIVTDYDLNGDEIDDTVQSSPGGLSITQTEGSTTATQQIISPVPDGFEVAVYPELNDTVLNDVFVNLSGATTVPGPDDFQYAVSWDRNLASGQSITATVRQTITVPEPMWAWQWAACLLALSAIARRRRPRGRSGRRCRPPGVLDRLGEEWPADDMTPGSLRSISP